MKTFKEIVKLLDAGFTHDEILAMEEEPAQPAAPETPEAQPDQPAAPAAQPAPEDVLAGLIQKIDRKLTELQAANIYNQQMPTEQPHAMTDVEALEELIRPHQRDN